MPCSRAVKLTRQRVDLLLGGEVWAIRKCEQLLRAGVVLNQGPRLGIAEARDLGENLNPRMSQLLVNIVMQV